MKMSRTQRFYWSEPYSFVRARAHNEPAQSRLFLLLCLVLAFTLIFILVDPPENLNDLSLIAVFSLPMALLISYPGMWLFSLIPNGVLIDESQIVIGREIIPFKDIESAIVGTTRIANKEYPVFSFQTLDRRSYLFGLSGKIDPLDLAAVLKKSGVTVL